MKKIYIIIVIIVIMCILVSIGINILFHKETPIPTILKDCVAARNKYLLDYSDIAYWKLDPWIHYQQYGKNENRKWDSNLC